MADDETQPQVYPLPQSYNKAHDDEELGNKARPLPQAQIYSNTHDQELGSGNTQSRELRKKKRMKCLAYILAFVVFQTGIIVIFSLTIMKVRTPKFRVRSATFDSFEVETAANPAFHLRMNAQLSVKNANFGTYKFKSTPIVFFYDGTPVGQAILPAQQAGWRTNKKFNVVVDLSSDQLSNKSQLGKDLESGILKLNALSSLSGKVRLTFVFMKKKPTNMNCTIDIGLADKTVRAISCK